MINFLRVLILLIEAQTLLGADCNSCLNAHNISSAYVEKRYSESGEHLENPHRGFNGHIQTRASQYRPITKAYVDRLREHNGVSVTYLNYALDLFLTSPISDDFLHKIRQDFAALESAGFTVVLRFSYTFDFRKPPGPYGDASKNIVLHHISQLKPIFHQYEGLITTLQAGFIGTWGEWYYTDHFGMPNKSAAGSDPVTGLSEQALRDRQDLLLALLHAAPKSLHVQVRYPAQKMHMMGSQPATVGDMQSEDSKARTGHHNDCFLASDNDVGTYKDKAVEYPYLARDTRYCIVGGETCDIRTNTEKRYECPKAKQELAMFHWTFLNGVTHFPAILDTWKREGCYSDIHRRLGYRLTISRAILPKSVRVNDNLCFHLEFTNTGYAAPVKHLKFFFILKSTTSSSQHYAAQVTGVDVRDWQPGYTHTVASTVQLNNLPEGHYKVLVSLSDPLLGGRADYNVLLATTGVPLYTQGLNDLGHTLTVSGHHSASSNCPTLSPWKPPANGHYSRVFKAEAADCVSCIDANHVTGSFVEKTYNDSDEFVENPHRGFVDQVVTHSNNHHALTKSHLDRQRSNAGITMIWRTYVLDTFLTSRISDDFLDKIRHDLDVLDSASFTVVLRFCYLFEKHHSHPYGDASKNIVLQHISQLKPIFHQYERVITSIEAGFIGAWGEWHSTEYFGNPEWHTAGHDPVTGLMPQAFQDRKDVLLALLRAAPQSV